LKYIYLHVFWAAVGVQHGAIQRAIHFSRGGSGFSICGQKEKYFGCENAEAPENQTTSSPIN
jgi:hypothetical protein